MKSTFKTTLYHAPDPPQGRRGGGDVSVTATLPLPEASNIRVPPVTAPKPPPKPILKNPTGGHQPYTAPLQIQSNYSVPSESKHSHFANPSVSPKHSTTRVSPRPQQERERHDSWFDANGLLPAQYNLPQKKADYFESELTDTKAKQGADKSVRLEARFSKPNAKIRWYKGKHELFHSTKHEFVYDEELVALIINNLDMRDAGNYTVEANGITSTAYLTVEEPQAKYSFTQLLPGTLDAIRTKQAVLDCKVSHHKAPVTWFKNNQQVQPGNPRLVMKLDALARCTLTIKTVEEEDEGTWMAKIDDRNYTICNLFVEEPRFEFVIPVKSQKSPEGQDVVLECEVNDKDAVVEWFHDGRQLSTDGKKYDLQGLGRKRKLFIKTSNLADEGEYKCTTKDDQTIAQLIVEPANKFIEKLKDVTGIENQEVTLSCTVRDSRAIASWFKNGAKITGLVGSKYEIRAKNGTHTLLIRTLVQVLDQDLYEIYVGGLKSTCRVTVLEGEKKPVINFRKKVEAELGRPLILKIPYTVRGTRLANPEAVLLRHGQPIGPQEGVHVHVTPDHVELQLHSPQKNDTGKYELALTNPAGTTIAPFDLEVKSRPSPPEGPLQISDISAAGCMLKWKKPRDDGNSPITGYIVEMQEGKSGHWQPLGETKTLDFKVKGLTENGEYRFRVKAKNAMGESEPLTGESMVARNATSRPTLDKTALRNIKVKVGEVINYDIRIGGTPTPEVSWTADQRPLKNGGRVTISKSAAQTTLRIEKAERGDSGRYTIKLKNQSGEDTASATVTVVGKPSPPRGPLDVSGVKKNGCTLSWQPPLDDGGEPIEEYIIEAQEVGAPGPAKFVEIGKCGPQETHFKTKDGLKPLKEYKFRVRAKNREGISDPLETAKGTIMQDAFTKPTLDRSTLKDQRVKVGEPIKYEVKISGEPTPDVDWSANQKPLKNGGRVKIATAGNKAILEVANAQRSDCGQYAIYLKNSSGTDSASANVTVVGKPTPPKGPLQITGVHNGGCTLAWNRPDDDGGEPITEYVIEAQDCTDPTGKFAEIGKCKPHDTSFKVNGFVPKREYKFRVRARNKEGLSDPLQADRGVVLKDSFDEPGKPGTPRIVDFDAGRIDIEFSPPLNDGGSPIEKYIIEMKSPGDNNWTKALETPTTRASIKGLRENQEYQFRVKAVNKAGTGPPSDASDKQAATSKNMKPFIAMNSLRDLTVKAGNNARLDAAIGGRPYPDVTWLKDGKLLDPKADQRLQIEARKGEKASLTIQRTNRKDCGRFTLKLKNPIGEDQASANLTVVDKPSKPEGPLEVYDVFEDRCTLKWKPPLDNGGEPVDYYEIEKMDEKSGQWMPAGRTRDTGFNVKGLIKGQIYHFRVRAVNKEGISDPLQTTQGTLAKNPEEKPMLDKSALKDLKVRVGHLIEYDVRISGEPLPSVRWLANEKDLTIERRAKILIDKNRQIAHMSIANALRSDGGRYTIEVRNNCGQDSASANVTVIGKPSPPKGPLTVSQVHKDGCTLSWQPPADDGGEPITEYIVEAQEVGSGGKFFELRRCKPNECSVKLTGLKNKKEYLFRVKAKNREGDSDPLHAEHGVIIKDAWDEPGKPGTPQIVDCDFDHMDIQWAAPASNGGAPIEKYIVEMKDAVIRDWVFACDATATKATVKGLKENREYQFRVTAVNKAGPGEPSDPSDRMAATAKFLRAFLNVKAMKSITVHAGEPATFDVPIGGRPPPDAFWFKAEKLLDQKTLSNQNTHIGGKHGEQATLHIERTTRKDCATYTLRVKNSVGESEASAELCVLDRPAPPEGPLEVLDVFDDHCLLTWKAPLDDGGEFVQFYDVEKMDEATGQWNSVGRTRNTHIKADSLQKGHIYHFRVRAVNGNGASEPLQTTKGTLAKNPYEAPDAPGIPEVVDWDADFVDLVWTPPKYDGGAAINGYFIEMTSKQSRGWSFATEIGSPECKGSVRGLTEYDEYQFRVRAVNRAGYGKPSGPSKSHLAKARRLKPHISRNAMQRILVHVGQTVTIEVPVRAEPPAKMNWSFKNETLYPSADKHGIVNEERATFLTIRDIVLEDGGLYTLEASNEHGADTCDIDVVVLGGRAPLAGLTREVLCNADLWMREGVVREGSYYLKHESASTLMRNTLFMD